MSNAPNMVVSTETDRLCWSIMQPQPLRFPDVSQFLHTFLVSFPLPTSQFSEFRWSHHTKWQSTVLMGCANRTSSLRCGVTHTEASSDQHNQALCTDCCTADSGTATLFPRPHHQQSDTPLCPTRSSKRMKLASNQAGNVRRARAQNTLSTGNADNRGNRVNHNSHRTTVTAVTRVITKVRKSVRKVSATSVLL